MTDADLQKFLVAIQNVQRARHADRAAVVTTAILQIIRRELRAWVDREGADLAGVRAAIETGLREEVADIQQQTLTEIRPNDE
jgi:hypothetical protein